jgi:gamma-glutamyl phosphate reductase
MKYLNTKPGSIEEVAASMSKYAAESEYQDMFKKELEKAGKGIGSMTPAEKKAFFNKIDTKYKAKDEQVKNPYAIGMAAAMKAKDDNHLLKNLQLQKHTILLSQLKKI